MRTFSSLFKTYFDHEFHHENERINFVFDNLFKSDIFSRRLLETLRATQGVNKNEEQIRKKLDF